MVPPDRAVAPTGHDRVIVSDRGHRRIRVFTCTANCGLWLGASGGPWPGGEFLDFVTVGGVPGYRDLPTATICQPFGLRRCRGTGGQDTSGTQSRATGGTRRRVFRRMLRRPQGAALHSLSLAVGAFGRLRRSGLAAEAQGRLTGRGAGSWFRCRGRLGRRGRRR